MREGRGGGDNAERSIARSNKKIDKNVTGDIRKFGRRCPGETINFLSRKISTSVGQRIILVLSPGLSVASQRGGFGKRQEPRVRFQ